MSKNVWSKRFSRLARLATGMGVVFAFGLPALSGSPAYAAVNTPTSVLGSGSDVAFHVMTALDSLYDETPGCTIIVPSGTQPLDFSCQPQSGDITTENYLHDQAHEAAPIGGSAAINQLCKQTLPGVANIDFARQTSGPATGVCTGLHYVAYGRDGVTWEAFPGVANSATASMNNQSGACSGSNGFCLTQQQLQGIYVNCTITNWNQVGGANHKIVLYTILPQYGTRKAFDTFLGGSSSTCPNVKLVDQTDNSEIVKKDKPYAIVPVSAGSWRERYAKKPAGANIGAIDGVAPSIAQIQSGAFPFSRFLYNVYCAGDPSNGNLCGTASPASAAVTNYVGEDGWICTSDAHALDPITGKDYRTEAAALITKYGFADLPIGATGGGTTLVNYCRLFTT